MKIKINSPIFHPTLVSLLFETEVSQGLPITWNDVLQLPNTLKCYGRTSYYIRISHLRSRMGFLTMANSRVASSLLQLASHVLPCRRHVYLMCSPHGQRSTQTKGFFNSILEHISLKRSWVTSSRAISRWTKRFIQLAMRRTNSIELNPYKKKLSLCQT